jgi:outer membrane protein assembly factor BamB
MRPRRRFLLPILAAIASLAPLGSALAQCPTTPLWTLQNPVTQAVTDAPSGLGMSFFALGPTLFAVWNDTGQTPAPHTGGTVAWTWTTNTGSSIQNFPSPVPLSNNAGEYIFVTADDGFLYKISAQSGASEASRDLKRASCTPDKLAGTPAVQLYQFSNSSFQGAVMAARGAPDDLVYVATHYECGDHDHNRIYALWASDLTDEWVYNQQGLTKVDFCSDGPTIDYTNNRIYCGTNLEPQATGQNSLFAVNSITGASLWATNAGSILNRPTLGNGKLILTSSTGIVQKRDPNTGAMQWAHSLGAPTVRGVWPEFRPPNSDRIFVTTTDGYLHGLGDAGNAATVLWPAVGPGGGCIHTTAPAVAPSLGKLYVGHDDGTVHQIDLATGTQETEVLGGTPGTLWDPTVYASASGLDEDRLVITTKEGMLRQFCVPWGSQVAAPDPGAVADFALAQSAPNPATASALIRYDLPRAARVELDVYDVDGHRVRSLERSEKTAGRHEVAWNGLDDSGHAAPSGVYFYRLRAIGADGRASERARKIQLVR